MAINSVGNSNFLLGQSIVDLKGQLDALQTQLATGKKSTVYSGMGINEGFAIFARAQLSNLSAFTTTMTNINTTIDTTNTALTSFGQIATQVKSAAGSGGAVITGTGQTVGQQTAQLQLKSMLEMLNTQAGDRYLFSGSAIDTPSVASMDDILNGKGAQAGLKQLIAERNQADLGVGGLGRLVISSPTADVGVGRGRCRWLAVRLQAQCDHVLADRRDRHRPERIAAGGLGRSRRHQSQQRRPGHLHVQPAGRDDGSDPTDRLERNPAADRKFCDRPHVHGDGEQPQGRAQ